MDEKARAVSAAGLLYRYLLARARYRSVDPAVQRLSQADLACLIGGERREFDEIVVNPGADPPITKDAKHRDFFDAVVNKRGSIRDITASELAAHRDYVLRGAALPLREPVEGDAATGAVLPWPGMRRRRF